MLINDGAGRSTPTRPFAQADRASSSAADGRRSVGVGTVWRPYCSKARAGTAAVQACGWALQGSYGGVGSGLILSASQVTGWSSGTRNASIWSSAIRSSIAAALAPT